MNLAVKGLQKTSFIDYPGKIACVIFLGGCNFRCPYCHNGHLVSGDADLIPIEEVYSFLQKRIGILEAVVVSGGEPTLYGEALVELLKTIKEMGFEIKLDTNGTNPALLTEIINLDLVDYVAMDVKAPMSKYGQMAGADVDVSKITNSVGILKESGVDYEFRTTVCDELLNKEDIYQIIREVSPCRKLYLQNFRDGETVLAGRNKLSPVDYLGEISDLYDFVEVR